MTGAISDFMDGDQELGFLINLMTVSAGDGNQCLLRWHLGLTMANASHGTNPSTSATWSYDFFGANAELNELSQPGIAGVFDAHFANGSCSWWIWSLQENKDLTSCRRTITSNKGQSGYGYALFFFNLLVQSPW